MTETQTVPSATYRLQVTAEFSLFDAAAVTGYLADLGVGAVYVSPLLRSTTGLSIPAVAARPGWQPWPRPAARPV